MTRRIRHVKCDESRPSCSRCLSAKRVCSGYGIWDAANDNGHMQPAIHADALNGILGPRSSVYVVITADPIEKAYYEWFKHRTISKLPGSFISGFWLTLLLQTSVNEQTILHAILALSSIHKHHGSGPGTVQGYCVEGDEKFTLQQCVKATSSLQSRLAVKDRSAFSISLIACIIFVAADLLRGHFQTADLHLRHGLDVLRQMSLLFQFRTRAGQEVSRDVSDDWICESLSRLHLQALFCSYPTGAPHVSLRSALISPETILSINDAWRMLDYTLYEILSLTFKARRIDTSIAKCSIQQEKVLGDIQRWLLHFNIFQATQQGKASADEEKCYQLLRIYHTLAGIMARVSLSTSDESSYDQSNPQFLTLLNQLVYLWRTTKHDLQLHGILPYHMDMSRSIIDVGWIFPLYFLAIKCRIHRIRTHAVGLLERTFHREGFWDSMIAAHVAKKVVQMEEGDFYREAELKDTFSLCTLPVMQELQLPALPASSRLQELQVVLPGSPVSSLLLLSTVRAQSGDHQLLLSEYDLQRRQWKDRQRSP